MKRHHRLPGRLEQRVPGGVVAVAVGIVEVPRPVVPADPAGVRGFGSPVLATYVHALKLPQPAFVFTVSVFFQIFMVTQAVTFTWLGMLTIDRLYDGLVACIPIAIFLPLAVYLSRFINARWFNVIIIVLLMVIEARLVFKALA